MIRKGTSLANFRVSTHVLNNVTHSTINCIIQVTWNKFYLSFLFTSWKIVFLKVVGAFNVIQTLYSSLFYNLSKKRQKQKMKIPNLGSVCRKYNVCPNQDWIKKPWPKNNIFATVYQPQYSLKWIVLENLIPLRKIIAFLHSTQMSFRSLVTIAESALAHVSCLDIELLSFKVSCNNIDCKIALPGLVFFFDVIGVSK